jgi:protein-disulfide isomerase
MHGLLVSARALVVRCAPPLLWLLVLAAAAVAQAPAPATDDPVVATIDGRPVRLSDLDVRWREQDPGTYARLQQEQFEGRRRALDSIVAAHLLDAEASRRRTTVEKLLDEELPGRMPPVTEAEILEAYARSGAEAQGVALDQVRDTLVTNIESRRSRTTALVRYLDELRGAARGISIAFEPPRQTVPVAAGDNVKGPATARVEVVEFGDFQCPICRSIEPALKRLQTEHKTDVRLVWKDFPLDGHPDARPAAEAARCAADQGKFWDYHDKLFANQEGLGKSRLRDYAKQLKLDAAAFTTCVDKGRHRADVDNAVAAAADLGVSATPTVFINGRLVVGAVPYETYERIVREELGRATAAGK